MGKYYIQIALPSIRGFPMRKEELRYLISRAVIIAGVIIWLLLGLLGGDFFGRKTPDPSVAVTSAAESESTPASYDICVENAGEGAYTDPDGSKVLRTSVRTLRDGTKVWAGGYTGTWKPHSKDTSMWAFREDITVPAGTELAAVLHVADGDTLLVQPLLSNLESSSLYALSEFSPVYVRLSGIDTPESEAAEIAGYAKATAKGTAASEYVKGLLSKRQLVWLSPAGDDDTDQYGRMLRMVWLSEPSVNGCEDAEKITEKTLNALLLREGMADTLFLSNFRHEKLFSTLLENAKASGKGIWKED